MTTPNAMTQEHVDFLNDLRDSGSTNMFGAPPYLQDEFGLTRHEAKEIVMAWMKDPKMVIAE